MTRTYANRLRFLCVSSTVVLCLVLGSELLKNHEITALIALIFTFLALIPFGIESFVRSLPKVENNVAPVNREVDSRGPSILTICVLVLCLPYVGSVVTSDLPLSSLLGTPILVVFAIIMLIERRFFLASDNQKWLNRSTLIVAAIWTISFVFRFSGSKGILETVAIIMLPSILALEFFWLRWISRFDELTKRKGSKRILAVLPCITFAILVAWQVFLGQIAFQSNEWQNAGPWQEDATRWRMTRDLIENRLKPGMTVDQVTAVFGKGTSWGTALKPTWPIGIDDTKIRLQFEPPILVLRGGKIPKDCRLVRAYLGAD